MPTIADLRAAVGASSNRMSDEELLAAYAKGAKMSPNQAAMEFGWNPSTSGQWGNRASAAVDSYQSNLYGLGEALGSDWARRKRIENEFAADVSRDRAAAQGAISSFKDIGGVGDFFNYAGGLALDSAPYLGEALVGGGVGGLAARGLGLAGRAAARTAGAVGASYPSAVGDVLSNQRDQAGVTDLGSAAALGVPYALANAFGIEGALARGAAMKSGIRALDDMTGLRGGLARTGASMARGALTEAPAETFQEAMNQFGRMAVDPNETFFNERSNERFAESAVGGGVLGGLFGGGMGGWRRSNDWYADQQEKAQQFLAAAQAKAQADALQQQQQQQQQDLLNNQFTPPGTQEDLLGAINPYDVGGYVTRFNQGESVEVGTPQFDLFGGGGDVGGTEPVRPQAPLQLEWNQRMESPLLVMPNGQAVAPEQFAAFSPVVQNYLLSQGVFSPAAGINAANAISQPAGPFTPERVDLLLGLPTPLTEAQRKERQRQLAATLAEPSGEGVFGRGARVQDPQTGLERELSMDEFQALQSGQLRLPVGFNIYLPQTGQGVPTLPGVINVNPYGQAGATDAQNQTLLADTTDLGTELARQRILQGFVGAPAAPQGKGAKGKAAAPAAAPAAPAQPAQTQQTQTNDWPNRPLWTQYGLPGKSTEAGRAVFDQAVQAKTNGTLDAEGFDRVVEGLRRHTNAGKSTLAAEVSRVKGEKEQASKPSMAPKAPKQPAVVVPAPAAPSAPATGENQLLVQGGPNVSLPAVPGQRVGGSSAAGRVDAGGSVAATGPVPAATVGSAGAAPRVEAAAGPAATVADASAQGGETAVAASAPAPAPKATVEKKGTLSQRLKSGNKTAVIGGAVDFKLLKDALESEDPRMHHAARLTLGVDKDGDRLDKPLSVEAAVDRAGLGKNRSELSKVLSALGLTRDVRNRFVSSSAQANERAEGNIGEDADLTQLQVEYLDESEATGSRRVAESDNAGASAAAEDFARGGEQQTAGRVSSVGGSQSNIAAATPTRRLQTRSFYQVVREKGGLAQLNIEELADLAVRSLEYANSKSQDDLNTLRTIMAEVQRRSRGDTAADMNRALARADVASRQKNPGTKAVSDESDVIEADENGAPLVNELSEQEQRLLLEATGNLTTAEQATLEEHYGGPLDSPEVQGRLADDVLSYVNKGVKTVAASIRKIIAKLAKTIAAVAVFFNAVGLNPQTNTDAYARVAESMPAQVTVTAEEQSTSKRADYNGRELSPNAQRVANWIAENAEPNEISQILDPATGVLYVMKGGKIVADSPALFGQAGVGDTSRSGDMSLPESERKITPAGRFQVSMQNDVDYGTAIIFQAPQGGNVLTGPFAEEGFLFGAMMKIAIHRVYLGNPAERRTQRMQSASPLDNMISYGCINVSEAFYDEVLKKFDYSGKAFAYMLPSDPSKLEQFFDLGGRQQPAAPNRTPTQTAGSGQKFGTRRKTDKDSTYTKAELEAEVKAFVRVSALGRSINIVNNVDELLNSSLDDIRAIGEALRDPSKYGVFSDNRVWIVANRIEKGNGRAAFMHEVGVHLGLERLLPDATFNTLVDKIIQWADKNDGSQESKIARDAIARVPQTTPDEDVKSEVLAYFVEEAIKAGIDPTANVQRGNAEVRKWMSRLLAAFKTALLRLGFKPEAFTAQDIVNLAFGAARLEANGAWHTGADRQRTKFGQDPRFEGLPHEQDPVIDDQVGATSTWGGKSKLDQAMRMMNRADKMSDPAAAEKLRAQAQALLSQAASILERGDRRSSLVRTGADRQRTKFGSNAAGNYAATRARFDALNKALPPRTRNALGDIGTVLKTAMGSVANRVVFTHDLIDRAKRVGLASAERFGELYKKRAEMTNGLSGRVDNVARLYSEVPDAERGRGQGTVNDFIKDSTRTEAWGFVPDWLPEAKRASIKVDPAMAKRFNALSPQSQAFAKAVFEHGYKTLDLKKRTILGVTNNEYKALIKAARDAGDEDEVARLESDQKKAQTKFESLFKTMGDNPYAPLKRFGNWVVIAESKALKQARADNDAKRVQELEQNGRHYYVDFFESQMEALAAERELRAAGSYDDGSEGVVVRSKEEARERLYGGDGMAAAFTKLRNQARMRLEGEQDVSKRALLEMATDMYLSALAETSARKSEMRRRGIEGNIDIVRSFVTQGYADSHMVSALAFSGDQGDAINAMRRDKDSGSSAEQTRKSAAFNEIVKRHADSMEYREPNLFDNIKTAASLYYLAFSPAYYLQNLTQPWMVSLPTIAGRHDWGRTASAIGKAGGELKDAWLGAGVSQAIDLSKVPADVREAMQTLYDRGILTSGMNLESRRIQAAGATGVYGRTKQALGDAREFIDNMQTKVEVMNRTATAMAAYRLELAKGASAEQALEYADQVVRQTHGDYSMMAAPRFFNNDLGKLALQFRKYQLLQVSLMARLIRESFTGTDRAAAAKALGFVLGQTGLLAGAMGLPGFTAIAWVLSKLFGDPDEPDDPEYQLRKAIGNKEVADLILKGLPARFGVDLSNKIGWQNSLSLLPYTNIDLTKKSFTEIGMALATGPAGAMGAKMFDAMDAMRNGRYVEGLTKALPTGFGNAIKGADTYLRGVRNKDGELLLSPEEINMAEAVLMGIGLTPTEISSQSFRQRVNYEATTNFSNRAGKVKDDFVRAVREGDSGGRQEAIDAWKQLQDTRVENGFQRQPMQDLYDAVKQARKQERNTISGVQFRETNRRFVESLGQM